MDKKSLIIWKWVAWIQLEEILLNRWEKVYGFLDDSSLWIDIIWNINNYENILKENNFIDKVYFAIPSLENKDILKKIRTISNNYSRRLFIIPSIVDIIWSEVNFDLIREVKIEDLLFRPIKKYNVDRIKEFIKWKKILITWAAWTIWSELVHQCFKYWANQIIWIDHSEIGIFNISTNYLEVDNVKFYIKTLKDRDWLENVFIDNKIDIVFNAAAYKHVYQMELNPDEAINNNVFWLKNIIEIANKYNVKDFCQISTDKAVNPTNIMWASKRIWELMMHYYSEKFDNMNMVAVRFGNVLWSSWSVLEIFKEQIKKWENLTVTDPEIIRYFMSIEEAVNLVITSTTLNKNWVIFVLDMWNPIKIIDLAKKYIELSNANWIDIDIIWLKPGEKLYEELILDKNNDQNTIIDEIFITEDKGNYKNIIKYLDNFKWIYDKNKISNIISQIIPEFKHNK